MPENVSRWHMFVLWFAANRRWIGGAVSIVASIVRYQLAFADHVQWADHLKALADLIILGGAYTVGAGSHMPDAVWEERKQEATLPLTLRSPRRRNTDA